MIEEMSVERFIHGAITCPTCDKPFLFSWDDETGVFEAYCCDWQQLTWPNAIQLIPASKEWE